MFQNCLNSAKVKIVKNSTVSFSLKRKHNKIHNIPNIEMFQIKHIQFLNLFLKFLDKQHSRTILEQIESVGPVKAVYHGSESIFY